MERYKIALVSDWYLPRIGGLEVQMHGLARQLRARGHEVHVYTTTPGDGCPEPDGVIVHRLPLARAGGVVTPNPLNLLLARRTLREERFDVVHGHGLLSIMTIGVLMSARALKVPCVLTSHSLLRGGAFGVAAAALAFHGRTDVIAAVSRTAAADLAAASRRRDVMVLPNGIDPAEWPRMDRGADRPPRVTSVLRLSRKKNAAELIDAMPRVLERAGDARPRFTIVGDGPDRPALQRRVAQLRLGDAVEFLGWRSRGEIAAVLASSTVFAMPCRREAFGLAALEARCAGVPVVAMQGGGVGELVEDGRHGFLAETRDGFADAIALLLRDRERHARLSRQARSGLGRFAWPEVIRAHLQAYRLAMSRRTRGRVAA